MHRHITYYTQSVARVDSQINFSVVVHGRMQDLPRGANYFFGGVGAACDAWRSHAFARGVRGNASPKFFLEWYNLVRFGVYFHNFFTFKSLKISFFSNVGGLFATFYFMVEAFFWACTPPLRKFLRASMIAGGFESMLPGNFFV